MTVKSSTARTALAPRAQDSALAKLRENFSIELAPFAEIEAAQAFQRTAAGIAVTEVGSHKTGLEAIRQGKALKRGIDEHWARVLRWLEDRKKDIRGIRDEDLALVDPGLTHLNAQALAYETAEKRRIAEAEDRQRRENERIAQEQRQSELDALERLALESEAGAADLSDREQVFVAGILGGQSPHVAANSAGFKDPEKQASRLLDTLKITEAIEAGRAAKALREQAAAVAEKPVDVQKPQVESGLAKVAGVRTVTTWTGECIDRDALIDAVLQGVADRKLLMPNQPAINELARAVHENLDRTPGLRHVKTVTKAG